MNLFRLTALFIALSVEGEAFGLRQSQGRLIGGQDAYHAQFPFMAAIYTQTQDFRLFCGGSLISNQWILTSGHCVIGGVMFTIQLGSRYLTNSDPSRLTLASSHYEVHPAFTDEDLQNDIGLISLRLPIDFTDFIKVTDHLPTTEIETAQVVVATGWGQINDVNSALSETLQWTILSAISLEECRKIYGTQITEHMVCVSGNFNEGPCIGDSGGPLLHVLRDSYMVHIGVASFVSGHGCESLDPAGYTKTYSYIDWIRNLTNIED